MRAGRIAALGLLILGLVTAAYFAGRRSVPPPPPPSAPPPDTAGAWLAELRALYEGPSAHWPPPRLGAGVAYRELAPLAISPRPGGDSAQLVGLGERLFEDPRLSASGQISCQSCHNRRLGWGDGLPTSFGHGRQQGRRNAPALFNASYRASLFWDGRAADLREQALGPLLAADEMANPDLAGVPEAIAADEDYRAQFAALFGDEEPTLDGILAALAAFQQTLARRTRFDRFLLGESRLLSDEQIHGLHLFRTKAGCANCHHGPLLTDERFHNIGLSYYGRQYEDLGRFEVTGEAADVGRFRTPSLRHLARTAPYMHNGLFPSLAGIVNLYAAGGGRVKPERAKGDDDPLIGHLLENSPLLEPRSLTPAEKEALVAFLEAL